MRRALIVALEAKPCPIRRLMQELSHDMPIEVQAVPNISSCLAQMARFTPDLLIFSRVVAGDGKALAEVLERCRPDFTGWVIVIDKSTMEIIDCATPAHASRRLPLMLFPKEVGWASSARRRVQDAPRP